MSLCKLVLAVLYLATVQPIGADNEKHQLVVEFIKFEFDGGELAKETCAGKAAVVPEQGVTAAGPTTEEADDLRERFGDHLTKMFENFGEQKVDVGGVAVIGYCSMMFSFNVTLSDVPKVYFGARYRMRNNVNSDECTDCKVTACFESESPLTDTTEWTIKVDAGHYVGNKPLPHKILGKTEETTYKNEDVKNKEQAKVKEIKFGCDPGLCDTTDKKNFKVFVKIYKPDQPLEDNKCSGGKVEETTAPAP